MNITQGDRFVGRINGANILVLSASDKYITYKIVSSGKIFTMGRKTFEHLLIDRQKN